MSLGGGSSVIDRLWPGASDTAVGTRGRALPAEAEYTSEQFAPRCPAYGAAGTRDCRLTTFITMRTGQVLHPVRAFIKFVARFCQLFSQHTNALGMSCTLTSIPSVDIESRPVRQLGRASSHAPSRTLQQRSMSTSYSRHHA